VSDAPRFAKLDPAVLTDAQRRVRDAIVQGPRGDVRGPFNALLRSPDLADRAQRVGEYIRFGSSLPAKLNELAILVTARHWTAQYEWCAHHQLAMKAGLDPAVMIDVINASTGRNSATVDKFPRAILPRTFDYGGPLSIGTKDLQLYLDEARAEGTTGLSASNAAQLWALAERRFGARADMTMVFRLLEEWAGLDGAAVATAAAAPARDG